MKRIWMLLLAGAVTLSLAACGGAPASSGTSRPTGPADQQEELLDQEIPQNQTPETTPAGGPDLSAYTDHGEWQSGRMWVRKTESSWDGVQDFLGYIDTDGNLVGQWHPDDGVYYFDEAALEAFEAEPEMTAAWKEPGDFQGNYAVINCGDCTEVIDLQGNTVAKYAYYSVSTYVPKVFALEDDLQIHFYYPRTDRERLFMLRIENGTAEAVPVTENLWPYAPEEIRCIDKEFVYCDYNSIVDESFFFILDENGQTLTEGSLPGYEAVTIRSRSSGDAAAELVFLGEDGNRWCVEIDARGSWLGDPVAD